MIWLAVDVFFFAPFQCLEYNPFDPISLESNQTSIMRFEQFDLDDRDKERRNAITESIRVISVEELRKLGEEGFDELDRPWRQTFLEFIAQHPGATLHYASVDEGVK